jgi:hypothetical protein
MKRILLRSGIALVAFALGIAVTVLWMSIRPTRTIPPVVSRECEPLYDAARVWEVDDAGLFRSIQELPVNELPDCVDEAYSLLWIPSFHEPVYVRVWHSTDGAFIVAKMLDSKGWSKFGNVKAEHSRALTVFEWRSFTELLDRASYWEQHSAIAEMLPQDGASWTIQGVRNKRHHLVERRVPDEQFAQICKHLIRLSGLQTAHALYLPSE